MLDNRILHSSVDTNPASPLNSSRGIALRAVQFIQTITSPCSSPLQNSPLHHRSPVNRVKQPSGSSGGSARNSSEGMQVCSGYFRDIACAHIAFTSVPSFASRQAIANISYSVYDLCSFVVYFRIHKNTLATPSLRILRSAWLSGCRSLRTTCKEVIVGARLRSLQAHGSGLPSKRSMNAAFNTRHLQCSEVGCFRAHNAQCAKCMCAFCGTCSVATSSPLFLREENVLRPVLIASLRVTLFFSLQRFSPSKTVSPFSRNRLCASFTFIFHAGACDDAGDKNNATEARLFLKQSTRLTQKHGALDRLQLASFYH